MDVSLIERESTVTIVNARSELERAALWLRGFAARARVPEEVCRQFLVILDEVLSNILNHGLAGAPAGSREIVLQARLLSAAVELEVIDDGPAFDPTTHIEKGRRREGGAGLLFVQKLMDEVRFTRRNGRNC